MNKIAIITDSSSNLNFELAEKYDIVIIPYKIQMDGKSYDDLIEIEPEKFYDCIEEKNLLTGIPSPEECFKVIDDLIEKGINEIIIFTMAPKLSGMYNLMRIVKSEYTSKVKIEVIHSDTTAFGTGLLSVYASELRKEGMDFKSIVDNCKNKVESKKVGVYALFRTLKYVIRGGRLNKFKGAIGEFLKIQPIVCMEDGELNIIEKLRGEKLSRNRLLEIVKNDLKDAKKYYLAFFNAKNNDEVIYMKEALKDEIQKADKFFDETLTSVLGVHAGPSCIGAAYLIVE